MGCGIAGPALAFSRFPFYLSEEPLPMTNDKKTISFQCDQQLFDRIQVASRNERLSIEEYVGRVVHDHFNPAAKRRREYYTPRRFYTYEIDTD